MSGAAEVLKVKLSSAGWDAKVGLPVQEECQDIRFRSRDFVDLFFSRLPKGDPRNHTKTDKQEMSVLL